LCGQGRHVGGGHYICSHNNLQVMHPVLCEEWDPANPLTPDQYLPQSNKKVGWICQSERNCGCHKWPSTICKRVGSANQPPRGCPFCCNQKVCIHSSLITTHPQLCLEWDPENSGTPDQYSYGSDAMKSWICQSEKNCGCHKWPSTISHRTINDRNCPYCCNQKVCIHSNLKATHPKLCEEWSLKNLHGPEQYSSGSSAMIKWICRVNPLHKWPAVINNRAGRGDGCPHCSPNPGYSKVAIRWMDLIMSVYHINIQYALSPEGEFKIPNLGNDGRDIKVDGYCRETNTVYEFHGDYWHGNPLVFKPNDINKVNHKTFGELYQKTIEKENKIRALGYNLVVKWDTEQTFEIILPFQELTINSNNTTSSIEII